MCINADRVIIDMTDSIVKLCSPLQIFLVSKKNNSKGDVTSFKLCVIVSDSYQSHRKLESEILINTDCPVPCDIIVYNVSEWNECLEDDCSFAYRIDSQGEILYEQGE